MGYPLSERSLSRLKGVHEDMVRVVHRAAEITPVPFIITEGLRTVQRQAELVAKGASTTMNSKHLTGRAVDVAAMPGGQLSWEWKHYAAISTAFKQAAKELDVRIRWGGDWRYFKDGPHYELI